MLSIHEDSEVYALFCKTLHKSMQEATVFRQFKGGFRRGVFVQSHFWSAALGTPYFCSVSDFIDFGVTGLDIRCRGREISKNLY